MKELFIYQIKFKDTVSINIDATLERINSCTTYLNYPYLDKQKNISYSLLSAEKTISNYYFSVMKKRTHVNVNSLNDKTEQVTTELVDTDEFIRFGINLKSNLITIVKKGNFGIDQFTIAFNYMFKNALKEEFNIDMEYIEFIPVRGIPISWNENNLIEKIKELNCLKELIMNFTTIIEKQENNSNIENPITEKIELNSNSFSTNIPQIKELEIKYNKYLAKNTYHSVSLFCKDINNQKYIISTKDVLSYSYSPKILTDKGTFISKTKDTIEDYIKNYLNK